MPSMISQRRVGVAVALACFAFWTAPAAAEPEKLDVDADKTWQHRWTAMAFPPRLGSLEREEIYQFEDQQSNVSARYWSEELGTLFSIYIFRPSEPDPSLWHDRALAAIEANEDIAPIDPASRLTASFVPPGGRSESGIRSVYASGSGYKSTGVALYQAGEWLVKVRMSSQRLDANGLDLALAEAIAGLPELDSVSATRAELVQRCASTIEFSEAERADVDPILVATVSGILALPLSDGGEPRTVSEVRYCLEGPKEARYGIYRPNGAKDRYTIAFGDSGFSVAVGPSKTLDAVLAESGTAAETYAVTSGDALQTRIFAPFLSLPTPDQAAHAALREGPIAAISRPLDGTRSTITIYTSNDDQGAVEAASSS